MERLRDESGLVAAAAAGDPVAFERLVRAHADAVYGHALRFFRDHQTAEDVSQEVFLKVYRHLHGFDGRSSFSTWLFRMTRNACLDAMRRGRRVPVPFDPSGIPDTGTSDFSAGVVDSAALEAALTALPPEDRDAFNAVALFGMSYSEAAEAVGIPVGTVKSRVFRARRRLVTLLGEEA